MWKGKQTMVNTQIKNNGSQQATRIIADDIIFLSDQRQDIEWMILLWPLFGTVSFPNHVQSL